MSLDYAVHTVHSLFFNRQVAKNAKEGTKIFRVYCAAAKRQKREIKEAAVHQIHCREAAKAPTGRNIPAQGKRSAALGEAE